MSNKTISINPSLFSLGKPKTKKNKEKKTSSTPVPIISPNVLKNKLLKRIKEHKQRETLNLNDKITSSDINLNPDIVNFSDEFNDSINYLQTLSKQKRISDEKKKFDLQKQKWKEDLDRKTLKNYYNEQQNTSLINLDLPEELKQPIPDPTINETFRINLPTKCDNVPYGILKGGTKPSYREWTKTQKNNIVTNPNASLVIENNSIISEKTARENRLNLLKEKIKQKKDQINQQFKKNEPIETDMLIKRPVNNLSLESNIQNNQLTDVVNNNNNPTINGGNNNEKTGNPNNIESLSGEIIGTKHITKKTIKRKYTLGRSLSKNMVGILIKDRNTRKKILTAQKDLKRRNINDVKKYLREHNLIKTGSNAPNDVLRKIYESAMLTGEITNTNKDTLLHNFIKEDK
jgi:hypothetical protein